MIKIIDNLLPHMQWVGLHDYYLRGDCPWVYSEHVVCDEEKNPHFQFVHGILLGSGSIVIQITIILLLFTI